MKTMGLISIVVALHCAVIGSVFSISGCGTTSKAQPPPAIPAMPSPKPPQTQTKAPPAYPQKRKLTKPVPAKKIKLAGGGEYIVQAGDSLGVIAKRCQVTMAELIEANKLADPNKIKIGQKLILPARGQLPPATVPRPVKKAKAKAATTETFQAGGGEYVVKPGDNLSKIAARRGVKVSALREVNKLQSDKLKIGQKLTIPEKKIVAPGADSAALTAGSESKVADNQAVKGVKGTELAPMSGASGAPISSLGIIHVVQPNEDLISIAKLYAVTMDEIAELNQLDATNRTIKVGQHLKIP